jgi:chemotaxis protein CheC
MLGIRLNMGMPRVRLLSFQELGSSIAAEEETVAAVFLKVELDISGSMMFVLTMDSAHFLVNRLMGRPDDDQGEFDEMDLSALKEIGNIIGGSYLSALAMLTNMVISPSVPFLAIDMAAAILSVPAVQFGQYGDEALLIDSEFGDDSRIDGYFILLPDPESYVKILSALGMSDKE